MTTLHTIVLFAFVVAAMAQFDPQLRPIMRPGRGHAHYQTEVTKMRLRGSETFLSPSSSTPLEIADHLHRNFAQLRDGDPGPAAFLFHDIGALIPGVKESYHLCEYCFQDSNVTLVATGQKGARITFDVGRPTSLLCSDNYLLATSHHIYLKSFFFAGHHSVDISFDSEAEYADVLEHGIKLLAFNESLLTWIEATLDLIALFTGGHVPEENLKFLKRYMNVTWPARDPTPIDIPESQIRSGDVFLTQCLWGLDSFIAYGTGSHVGHCTVALWIQGKLHVCESTVDKAIGKGVVCTPYRKWLDVIPHKQTITLYLPLRRDVADRFNETTALDFVERMYGQPYGFRNFIFSWIDTVDHNFPAPFTPDLLAVYGSIVDALGGFWHQIIYNFSLEGVNHRLQHYYGGLGPARAGGGGPPPPKRRSECASSYSCCVPARRSAPRARRSSARPGVATTMSTRPSVPGAEDTCTSARCPRGLDWGLPLGTARHLSVLAAPHCRQVVRDAKLCRRHALHAHWSSKLSWGDPVPGARGLRRSRCWTMDVPPYTARDRTSGPPTLSKSRYTCNASSRVGTRTSTRGTVPGGRKRLGAGASRT
eukprot:gnl/Trimastix_PCT/958.p1 GENE.gnl/Trimastix_PCT/958~~gnl/Trimastix_PCT/958.p1  ORF type:complete len:593 (-),score=138.43 gnl/Trimastix_PCT/958:330-2108(-)